MESISRGDVVVVNFGPTTGSEVKKSRPSVVVSNNQNNRFAPVLTVIPLTSNVRRVYPFDVLIPRQAGLPKDSKAMANQIRTVSKERVSGWICRLPPELLLSIEDAILLHLGIDR